MRRTGEAMILLTRPVGEADLVVVFLSETEGKLAGSARSARRSRRRFGGGLDPLTRGRATWVEAEGRELVRLESFDVTVSFAGRQKELPWFYLFAYMAEVADTFARDRQADPRFYRLLRAAADASEGGSAPGTVRRWFELWTLRLQGLLPALDECAGCGRETRESGARVAPSVGDALCEVCASGSAAGETVRLSPEDLRWIREALKRPVDRMPEPGGGSGIDRLVRLLFQEFTGKTFRSARFLEA